MNDGYHLIEYCSYQIFVDISTSHRLLLSIHATRVKTIISFGLCVVVYNTNNDNGTLDAKYCLRSKEMINMHVVP